jgi:hypothetical protein
LANFRLKAYTYLFLLKFEIQNSVDVAWELLMDSSYKDLQQCIYQDQDELDRFRQLVVNLVMSTDILDKDAKMVREKRWNQAFGTEEHNFTEDQLIDLRATVLLEHAIQASDVIHAMQHHVVFRKWNERLFEEILSSFEAGRSNGKDPTGGWYEGGILLFDDFVIPLAKKLMEAGGVASSEYLQYAVDNRAEWASKGADVVRSMASKYHRGEIIESAPQSTDDDRNGRAIAA